MTLQGHFAVTSVLGSASIPLMDWRVLAFKQISKISRATHLYILSAAKLQRRDSIVSGDVSFMALFTAWGSLKRERQTGELYSQLAHMLFTDV